MCLNIISHRSGDSESGRLEIVLVGLVFLLAGGCNAALTSGGGGGGGGGRGGAAGQSVAAGGQGAGVDSSVTATMCSGDGDCASGQYCMGYSQACSGGPKTYVVGRGICHRDCSAGACVCGNDPGDCRIGECYSGGCVALPIPPCVPDPSSCPPGCPFDPPTDQLCGPVCRCDSCPTPVDAATQGTCYPLLAGLRDGGPGACSVAIAALSCTAPSGAGCGCLSNDPTTCAAPTACGPGYGFACTNQCAVNEYAAGCGGTPQPDGGYVYSQPPAGCRLVDAFPSGESFYCCPCQ